MFCMASTVTWIMSGEERRKGNRYVRAEEGEEREGMENGGEDKMM